MKYLCLILIFALCGCTKDRVDTFNNNTGVIPGDIPIIEGVLKINEILSNAVGSDPDWMEIYNPNDEPLQLDSARWYVSDDLTSTSKSKLPGFIISAHGFVQIICDGTSGVDIDGKIHASFSLSSAGEDALLSYKDTLGSIIQIDHTSFPPQSVEGTSYGRSPDGENNWVDMNNPTPGSSNN